MSQDCGFSLEDPLRETHCTGGHPTLVRGHGVVLEYYVVLCLVGVQAEHALFVIACLKIVASSWRIHCIEGHLALVSVRYCFAVLYKIAC